MLYLRPHPICEADGTICVILVRRVREDYKSKKSNIEAYGIKREKHT